MLRRDWRSVCAVAIPFAVLALSGAGLTGCAVNRFEAREPWRDQVEAQCLARQRVRPTTYVALADAIDGPGPCGLQHPFVATRLGNGSVELRQRVTLGCPALAEAELWLAEVIQPAANLYFGVPVARIDAGAYSCRGRNNQAGARLSEHAFGNALDIMSFTLGDGHVVTVKGGWRGTEAEQGFLREVFTGACDRFTTVLAPGSNVFHYDHIHVDLARHDPRGLRRVCQPKIKFEPQLGAGGAFAAATPRPVERRPEATVAPIDREEDDPYAVGSVARSPATRPVSAAPAPIRPRAEAPAPDFAEDGADPIY